MKKKMQSFILKNIELTILLFMFSTGALAQTITGTVTSSEDGLALPGVNISIKGTSEITISDLNGDYTIEVNSQEDVLVFSFIGMVTFEALVGDQTQINVELETSESKLDEIVVIGYGKVKKSDLTGSVGSVKGHDLIKVPTSSPEQALQGKVAGVYVASASGAPGSAPVIRIRGVGTLNNSSPIFVVDGVILDDITFLNSSDIESIEVLKDASATSIYGSRGANGVIIVTTKMGNPNSGQTINISTEYSLQYLPKKIDLLSGYQFAEVVNEINPGTYNNLQAVPNTDWQNEVYQQFAPLYNLQVSFSGSSDKYNYYFGVGYFNQEGIVPKSDYQRVSVKLNQEYKVAEFLTIGSNLSIAPDKTNNAADIVSQVYRAWPSIQPYNADGTFAEVIGAGNPLASIEFNNSFSKRIRAVGSFYSEFVFFDSFAFKSSFGFDLSKGEHKSFVPVYFVSPTQENSTSDLAVSNYENRTWLWENTITYNKVLGIHKINILAGYTAQENKYEVVGGSVENLLGEDPSLWYLDAGDTKTQRNYNSGSLSTMVSYLFRVNYSLLNRYLFTISLREDASSKFKKENRYGFFPSAAFGWNITNESFFPKSIVFTNIKLRGSWGMIGNEKINQNERYSLIDNQQNAVFGLEETLNAGASLGKVANPDLVWESTTQVDFGLEIGLWDDKLTAEFDYFNRTTEDILVGVTSPGHLGNGAFVKYITNAADVLNQGFEFSLGMNNQIGNLQLSVNATGAIIKNEVKQLAAKTGNDSFIFGGDLGNGQQVTRTEVGKPIGSFYGYQVIGIIQNQDDLDNEPIIAGQSIGDLLFADINHDGMIDANDRTYIGSPIPDFIYGFSISASYKGFSFSCDFQGQSGNEIYNGKNAVRPDLYNFESRLNSRWTGTGTSNEEPRPTAGGLNYEPSGYFIEDGSYLRLRTVTIGYELPETLVSKLSISNANVYLRGTNVYTFSKFTGYSPEIGGNDVISSGIDNGIYPISAILSVGLNVTF